MLQILQFYGYFGPLGKISQGAPLDFQQPGAPNSGPLNALIWWNIFSLGNIIKGQFVQLVTTHLSHYAHAQNVVASNSRFVVLGNLLGIELLVLAVR